MRRLWLLLVLAWAVLLMALPSVASAQSQGEWREQRTQRFAILYVTGSEAEAASYAGFVDGIYDEVSAIFGHRVAVPVTLRLYPTLERYYESNPLARGMTGIVAHADFRRNEVVVVLPQTRGQTGEEVQNNVRHELAHIVASDLSSNRLNVGFQEGVAQYVERPAPELETKIRLLRSAAEADKLLAWSDFDDRESVYGAPEIAYPQTLSVVAFLVDRYSFVKLREFLDNSALASGYRSALERTYGVSPTALEAEWRAWLPSYLDGGYRFNALSAYDLTRIEGLVTAGEYAQARAELEAAIEWLQNTSQSDTLQRARDLLTMSDKGMRADGLAQEARAALEAADYKRGATLADQARAIYAELGDARQDAALDAYSARAARGMRAAQLLGQARALATDWRSYPQARATADRAASDYLALSDQERAAEALALRETIDQRQTIFGGALLVVGIGGVLISLLRRTATREAEAW